MIICNLCKKIFQKCPVSEYWKSGYYVINYLDNHEVNIVIKIPTPLQTLQKSIDDKIKKNITPAME